MTESHARVSRWRVTGLPVCRTRGVVPAACPAPVTRSGWLPLPDRSSRPARVASLLVAFLPLVTTQAIAIEWRVTKGIEASATYSDTGGTVGGADEVAGGDAGGNPLDGNRSGEEASAESVLTISPFVRIDGSGRRSEFSATGQFELRRFLEEERDEFAPQIALESRTTLVERLLDFDASARVSQRSIGTDPLVGESLPRFGESEEVYEIGFGPTFSNRSGDRVLYEASYHFAASRSAGDELAGSDVHGVSGRLLGLAREEVILVGGGSYELVRFEGGQESTSGLVGAGVGYLFRPTLLGFVTAGRDRVEIGETSGAGAGAGAGTADEDIIEGGFWNVGARWRPDPRLDVELGYGERAYGGRPSASVTLTGRRSTIELAWSRSLAFAAAGGREDLLLPFGSGVGGGPVTGGSDADADGGGAPTPGASDGVAGGGEGVAGGDGIGSSAGPGGGLGGGGLVGGGPSLAPLARDADSVDEVVDLSYSLQGRRSTLSASIGWVRRERLESDVVSEGLEYGLGFERTLSRRTTASATWTAIESDSSDEPDRPRENLFRLALSVAL